MGNMQKAGIQGDWLRSVQKMYAHGKVRGIGSTGMTEWVIINKGIKQGCPMSPLLFALYTSVISGFVNSSYVPEGEPPMLMYADDMVVWGRTEAEFKHKLEAVCTAFDNIGLQLSSTKTEVQHNQWVVPSQENQDLVINYKTKQKVLKYLPRSKAIRYLGAWTTTDGDTDWGLELLKSKLEDRLQRIKATNIHAIQKGTLVKGKILSAWNYTTAVQEVDQKMIAKWESKLCQAVIERDLPCGVRRDLLFEKKSHGGLNMTSLQELYDVNRCRTFAHIIESGKRQEGRGQVPWAEQIVMREIMSPDPCLSIYKELQVILNKLKLKIQLNPTYHKWSLQGVVQPEQHEVTTVRAPNRLEGHSPSIIIDNLKVPTMLINWYTKPEQRQRDQGAEEQAKQRIQSLHSLRDMTGMTQEVGIRLRLSTIQLLEDVLQGEIWEAAVMPELISTTRAWECATIIRLLNTQVKPKAILLNISQNSGMANMPNIADKMQRLKQAAIQHQVPMIVITDNTVPTLGAEMEWGTVVQTTPLAVGWESPYEYAVMPIMENGQDICCHISQWGWLRGGKQKAIAILVRQGQRNINNMYHQTASMEQVWKCPACGNNGIKINRELWILLKRSLSRCQFEQKHTGYMQAEHQKI